MQLIRPVLCNCWACKHLYPYKFLNGKKKFIKRYLIDKETKFIYSRHKAFRKSIIKNWIKKQRRLKYNIDENIINILPKCNFTD